FTNGRVRDFVPIGDRLLFVVTESSLMVLKVPSLEKADRADVGNGTHLSALGLPISKTAPLWLGAGWLYDGWVYDEKLEKLKALWTAGGFHRLGRITEWGFTGPGQQFPPYWLSPWGVQVAFNGLRHGERSVGTLPNPVYGNSRIAILPDQPAAVVV